MYFNYPLDLFRISRVIYLVTRLGLKVGPSEHWLIHSDLNNMRHCM
jgi:hypothetical protein